MRRVCVFCGSQNGNRPIYAEHARRFGHLLVEQRLELVFGAGHVGLMGVIADAVLEAGGVAIGVIPQGLVDRELAHRRLTELHIVSTMHQRKALMADLSDAFVALAGGYGTGDELFEILTWAQLGLHHKPIALLNTEGYFDGLLTWIDHAVSDGFVKPKYRPLLRMASEPEAVLRELQAPNCL